MLKIPCSYQNFPQSVYIMVYALFSQITVNNKLSRKKTFAAGFHKFSINLESFIALGKP